MKKWIIMVLGYVILLGLLFISFKGKEDIENQWKTSIANNKAYDAMVDKTNDRNIALQLTADQLSYSKDSLLQVLNKIKKDNKIKDKDLKAVQYITTTLSRTDTITLNDTIFKETFKDRYVSLDTIVGDKWYNTKLILAYPSTIILKPAFKSEKNIIVSTKKETINPPKKFWLFRLFQKKHKVLNVTVIENNPYVDNQESRYVEIIK